MGMDEYIEKPATQEILHTEIEKNNEFWGHNTSPREHDPSNFRYTVHMFNPYNIQFNLGVIIGERPYSTSQATNLLEIPENLSQRVSLSMSLIDQDHTNTWGPGGLIVNIPAGNVLITSPTDAAVVNSSREALIRQASTMKKLTPEEVLEQTQDDSYNEIVALGASDTGDELELQGFLVMRDIDGDLVDDDIGEKLARHALRLHMPLVYVPRYRPDVRRIISANGEVTGLYGGKAYLFRSNLGTPFTVSTGAKSYFASPEEIDIVINYFLTNGSLSESESNELKINYGSMHAQRMRPMMASEGEGMNYIVFRNGTGINFDEYHYRAGDIFKLSKRGKKSVRTDISKLDFFNAVEENKTNMTDEELLKIQEMVI